MTVTIDPPAAAPDPQAPVQAPPAPVTAPADPARGPADLGRTLAVTISLGLALLALWSLLYVVVISGMQHARSQHQLYAHLRAQLAQATAPIGGVIPIGTPVATLSIPKAGLHGEVIVEGTTAGALRRGPGHLRTSPLPGQPGVSVVYGRSLSFGAPFGSVPQLKAGDAVDVVTDQGSFTYAVSAIRRAGDPFTLPPAGGSTLTMVTTDGGFSPDQVVYVDATLKGKAAADPGGRPVSLSDAEKIGAGEHDPLVVVQLVLWLQLFLIAGCVLTWLHSRWGRRQLWLVSAPVLLAILWGASNTAVRLLPNLL